MKKRTRLLSLVLSGVLMISILAACSSSTAAPSTTASSSTAPSNSDATKTETYTIQLGGSLQEEHPITQGLFKFKELAEEMSDGRIQVTIYPNGQLGSNREYYEQVQAGNIQMGEAGAVILANFTDKFKFTSLPFLFNSREACQNFLKSDVGQQMNIEIAEETNLYPLVYFENGWQAITNSKHEILTPDDLKELKIRTQENDILLKIYEEMGCNPMPMAFTELFTAMQQKTVDGQVNPVLVDVTGNYHEVQTHLTDVNAVYDLDSIVINYDYFKSLPADIQDIVRAAAEGAQEYQLKLSAEEEEKGFQTLADKGMTITRLTMEQRDVFKEKVMGVYDWFEEQSIEPKMADYLEAISASNQKFLDGKLEAVTGNDL
jgi:tripartite ATP-independent transporter DctP family solute receptor